MTAHQHLNQWLIVLCSHFLPSLLLLYSQFVGLRATTIGVQVRGHVRKSTKWSLSLEHTWRLNEGQEHEQKSNRIFSLSRSRDVLEQKQNVSTKERPSHNSRSRPQSSRPGSHRSRSFSTLIQRTRFLTSPKPDLPSKPSGSGAPGWSVSRVHTQRFNNRGRSFLSFSNHLHLIIISVQHFTIP